MLSTDAELVEGWQHGDQAAASALVHRHAPALARYIRSRGVASADIEDFVQEVFIKAFRGLGDWRGEHEGSMRGWLFRIAANHLKDAFRRSGRVREVDLNDDDRIDPTDPQTALEARETAKMLAERLDLLSPMQHEVFRLRVEDGLAYREIAVALETTAGAARVHYHNAVQRLLEVLE